MFTGGICLHFAWTWWSLLIHILFQDGALKRAMECAGGAEGKLEGRSDDADAGPRRRDAPSKSKPSRARARGSVGFGLLGPRWPRWPLGCTCFREEKERRCTGPFFWGGLGAGKPAVKRLRTCTNRWHMLLPSRACSESKSTLGMA